MWAHDQLSAIYANTALTRALRLATVGVVVVESLAFAHQFEHSSVLGCWTAVFAGRWCCGGGRHLVVLRESGVPVLLSIQTDADEQRERAAYEKDLHLGSIFVNDRHATFGLLAPAFEEQSYGISTSLYGVTSAEMPGVMSQLVPLVNPLLAQGINDAIVTDGAGGWNIHAKVSWTHPTWLLNDAGIGAMVALSFILPLAVRTRKSLHVQKVERARANGWCQVCEYDLKGQNIRCPECGQHTPIELTDPGPDLAA